MLLSELKTGESATILKVHGHGSFRKRIMEMGFVRGKRVDVLLNAPLKDPIKYKVMGYEVSLRRSEAAMINVITEEEALGNMSGKHATEAEQQEYISNVIKEYKTTINIALVGNPNSGKTSLFNAISGRHEHVGNYSGVTVDATQGTYKYKGYTLIITDLPGTYALSPYSPEERYVREHLETSSPDIILNVVAASNLERNLYLTTELIDMDVKCVVALNMYDELEKSGAKLDNKKLGAMLGLPMVPVIAKKGEGITELLDTIIEVYENRNPQVRHIHINNGHIIEEGLDRLKTAIKESGHELPKTFPPRYYALKMLEKDSQRRRYRRGLNRAKIRIYRRCAERDSPTRQRRGRHKGNTYNRRLGNAQSMGIPGILPAYLHNVLLHVQPRGLPAGMDRTRSNPVERLYQQHNARRAVERPHHRRSNRGRWKRNSLPAQHNDTIPVHIIPRGLGLSGASSLYNGQGNAQDRAARKIVHPSGNGIRMQRPGSNGRPHHRESQQPSDNDTDTPVHVVQRTNTHIHTADRNILPRPRRNNTDAVLLGRNNNGGNNGETDAAFPVQDGRNPVRNGTSAIPAAVALHHRNPHVGQMQAIPQEDGRPDTCRIGNSMVFKLLSHARRTRIHPGATHRTVVPRPHREILRTRGTPYRHEMAGLRSRTVGSIGKRDSRQHARRTLFRQQRRRNQRRPPVGQTETERRLHGGIRTRLPRLFAALLPVHSHPCRNKKRSRLGMGIGIDDLQHRSCMDNLLHCI